MRITARRSSLLAALALTGWFAWAAPQPAQALTVTATLCDANVAPGGCPVANTLDFGIRTNFVGVLGANRWTYLPFLFADATATFSGTMYAVDIAGLYIYLFGQGVATANTAAAVGDTFLNVGITQSYATAFAVGTFAGIDVGTCNAAAAGSSQTGFVFVNLVQLAGGGVTACPAIAQTFGPAVIGGLGSPTALTAVASFDFAAGANGQAITLPWGLDFPDPDPLFNQLNLDLAADSSLATIEADLNALGITQMPEPSSLVLLAGALTALGLRRRSKRGEQKRRG